MALLNCDVIEIKYIPVKYSSNYVPDKLLEETQNWELLEEKVGAEKNSPWNLLRIEEFQHG